LAAAIVVAKQKRRSVLWLDDLDEYLGADSLTRSDLDDLVHHVVVLASLRAHLRDEFSARYDPGRPAGERMTARAGREVLDAVTAEIRLDRTWSPTEVDAARASSDPRIAQAVSVADKHGVAETMTAGPALLRDWHDAWAATPRALTQMRVEPPSYRWRWTFGARGITVRWSWRCCGTCTRSTSLTAVESHSTLAVGRTPLTGRRRRCTPPAA
jgi:hypothetical protein